LCFDKCKITKINIREEECARQERSMEYAYRFKSSGTVAEILKMLGRKEKWF